MSIRFLLAGVLLVALVPAGGVLAFDADNPGYPLADTGSTGDSIMNTDSTASTSVSSTYGIGSDVTATRTLNTTDPRPGAVVRVTTTVTLDTEQTVDIVDEFDPEFTSAQLVSVRINGTEISPDFQLVAPSDILVSAENVGSGTLEFVYDVTVPINASAGQTHTFDGLVQIDGNTTIEMSDSQVVVTPPTAKFAVAIDSVEESVAVGESVTAAVTVTNTGDTTGTQTVSFTVDGKREGTEELTLAPGANKTVRFAYETVAADQPELNLTVASANETAMATVDVLARESFAVAIDSVEESVAVGENVTVVTTIRNTGDTTGTQTVSFTVDGESKTTEELTLAGGENATSSFTYRTRETDTPKINIGVASANETAAATVEVLTSASFGVELRTVDDSVVAGENTTVEARVINNGDTTGTQEIVFSVNGRRGDGKQVTLDGGESTTLMFTYVTSETDRPEIEVAVASANETATAVVEVLSSASFAVAIDTVDDVVVVGETLTVTATLTNTGGVAGTQNLKFAVDSEREGVKQISLAPGSNETVNFAYETVAADRPELNLTIASANETATATIAVPESPTFEVSIESVPESVVAGEKLSVAYAVENTGEETTVRNVTAVIEGKKIVNETIELTSGESTTRTVEYSPTEADIPAVSVEITTANNTATETIAVLQPAAFVIDIVSIPASVTTEESIPIEYAIENVGNTSARQTVEVVAGQETVANDTIELAGGESTTRMMKYRVDNTDRSKVSVEIVTANDTATASVDILDPGAVVVDIVSAPESISPGETARIEYVVQNTCDQKVTQNVTVTADGNSLETETVALAGGAQFTDTVIYKPPAAVASETNITVTSSDHAHTVLIPILEPATFVIERISIPESTTVGDSVAVEYTVENIGDLTATQPVIVTVGGKTVANNTIDLASGQSTTETVTYESKIADTPSVPVTVASANKTMTEMMSVLHPTNLDLRLESVPDSVVAGELLPVVYVVENTGERIANQTITVSVDGETIRNDSINLAGGESTTQRLSYETDETDLPAASVTVAGVNETATKTTDIVTTEEFAVTIDWTSTDNRTAIGEITTIAAVIEHTGNRQTTQEVALRINDRVVTTTTVTTVGSEQLEFSYVPDTTDSPNFSFTVSVAGETATGGIAVTSVMNESGENTSDADDDGSGFGLVGGLLSVLLGTWIITYRLRQDDSC